MIFVWRFPNALHYHIAQYSKAPVIYHPNSIRQNDTQINLLHILHRLLLQPELELISALVCQRCRWRRCRRHAHIVFCFFNDFIIRWESHVLRLTTYNIHKWNPSTGEYYPPLALLYWAKPFFSLCACFAYTSVHFPLCNTTTHLQHFVVLTPIWNRNIRFWFHSIFFLFAICYAAFSTILLIFSTVSTDVVLFL